jgi:hypothetical protein
VVATLVFVRGRGPKVILPVPAAQGEGKAVGR